MKRTFKCPPPCASIVVFGLILLTATAGCKKSDSEDLLPLLALLGPAAPGGPAVTVASCPIGYITVPANAAVGTTSDFCVAKYEMKNNSGAKSEPAGSPWVSISQTDAKTACTNLGGDYHLITNPEWMTIARNIESVASNWSSGTVGTGTINSGHNDNVPGNALAAGTDDTDGCNGTGQTCPSTQKRTHTLSNGEVLWDFAGNVQDWVDWNVVNDKANSGGGATEFNVATPTTAMPATSFLPADTSLTSANGVGRYIPGTNGSGGAALRGGAYAVSLPAGVFGLRLFEEPSDTLTRFGFRCARDL